MSAGRAGVSRLTRNIVESVVGQGILFVLGFVATRYINRRLGADVLGLYYLSLAIAAVSSAAVEMGVSTSLVREIATHRDTDRRYVRDLVGTAGSLYWVAFGVFVAVLWTVVPFVFTRWVTLETLSRDAGVQALRLFTLSAFLTLPRLLYASILQGLQRFGSSNAINVAGTAVQQVGTLVLLSRASTAQELAAWYAISSSLALATAMLVCARALGTKALLPRFSLSALRKNARFAGNAMATSFFSTLVSKADRFLLGTFLPMADLGHYGVAQTIVQKVLGVVNSVELAGYPALARAEREGRLVPQLRKIDDAICLVTVPGFAAVVFAEGPLLGYIFDPAVASRLLVPTILLCLGSYMNATVSAPYRATLAIGRPEFAARLNLHAMFVVLPVTFLLVWQFGMLGAALAWVAYHVFSYAYFVPKYAQACLGIGPWLFYGRVARILAAAVTVFGGTLTLLVVSGMTSVMGLAAGLAGASAIWAVVAFHFLATEEFRRAVGHAVAALRKGTS